MALHFSLSLTLEIKFNMTRTINSLTTLGFELRMKTQLKISTDRMVYVVRMYSITSRTHYFLGSMLANIMTNLYEDGMDI